MNLNIIQVSSLEKIRPDDAMTTPELHKTAAVNGERISYQICIKTDTFIESKVSVESELKDYIQLYHVKNAVMDMPARDADKADMVNEDYITLKPGLMPDILVPLTETNNHLKISNQIATLWVRADIPADFPAGTYPIHIRIQPENELDATVFHLKKTMFVEVVPALMPAQKLIYTRWFYADCIAVQHNVEIYSEEHWSLIDKYIAAAADVGINMILVPVHTPPLDTAVGTTRPCVQLVDIEKKGEIYEFNFAKFHRFIAICKKNGIQYYEIAHMFSQWGAKWAPNIMVTENGKKDYLFGWHVASDSELYVSFLKQYIQAISEALHIEGISEKTYFHISDEPHGDQITAYKRAYEIIRPLIGSSKTFDALSEYAFYEKGLVECPVTGVQNIQEFLEHDIENQWTYYCCAPEKVFTNGFMAMPSHRVRILGFLLYKYNIKGFLHWGFNFYNAALSRYPINPYLTTSSDRSHASGDPFIVYPARDGVYGSIRGQVLYDGIQDMNICFALEEKIGRDAVVAMIDEAAGYDLRFDTYPKNKDYLLNLRAKMIQQLKQED